ncbi:MAG TPA: chemotaxis response regulator protein-glutamate methylesterase [Spirochaetota bacterium]|nr:chemotaxis response regulator protein-glutamate methylesterase [Spirochaetota bacterium]HOL56302.1 chemotaxis response regulator protein-glutamate methylesterase [Spirochaetota bacterium]HPP03692.1 chemotaxis response regulator protein-glutamate methylesterase [Spirochaetota bacterium]
MQKKIKVFTIDDSPIYRQVLREIINSDPDLEYCGFASNGSIAIKKIPIIKPDIITLDIEMPEMDGIETLRYIMENDPRPVIMVSSFTKDGADITFKALELGAVDYIQKPEVRSLQENVKLLEDVLISKIKIFANFKLPGTKRFKQIAEEDGLPVIGGLPSFEIPKVRTKPIDIICIGSSTGGTVALTNILPNIDKDIGVPILIVQHMPPLYTNSFAKRLDSLCSLRVVEAEDGMDVEPNTIYIAQGGYHLVLKGGKIFLDNSEPVNNHKPSVDVLFRSVSREMGDKALAIILTGMGSDGAQGIVAIKDAGGYTIAQDEESSVIFGMPGSAIRTGKVDRIIPLGKIADFINEFIPSLRNKK